MSKWTLFEVPYFVKSSKVLPWFVCLNDDQLDSGEESTWESFETKQHPCASNLCAIIFLILLGWEIKWSLRSMLTLKRGYGMEIAKTMDNGTWQNYVPTIYSPETQHSPWDDAWMTTCLLTWHLFWGHVSFLGCMQLRRSKSHYKIGQASQEDFSSSNSLIFSGTFFCELSAVYIP